MSSFNKAYTTLRKLCSPTAIFCFVPVLFAILLSFRTISSLDYGIHIATGRWILKYKQVPQIDPFSWSFSDHTYLAYHWGFQVIIAKLEAILGLIGPVLFRCLVISLTTIMLLLNLRLQKVRPTLGALCVFLALVILDGRMLIRPELFSYLLLAAIALAIEYRRNSYPMALVVIPIIFLVWINTHIYIFGLFIMSCYVIQSIAQRNLDKPLCLTILASLPVLLLNPYGIEAIVEPLHLLTRLDQANPFKQTISELRSPIAYLLESKSAIVLDRSIFGWLLFTLCMFPSCFGLLKKREWASIIILLVFWFLSATAIRNIGLLAVAGLPPLATGLRFFLQGHKKLSEVFAHRYVQHFSLTILLLSSLRVVTGAWYVSNRSPVRLEVGYESGKIPVQAASFVEGQNLKGRGFNTLNAGGALLLNAASHKVFIDGRNEVTNEDFLLEYLRITRPENFQNFADDSAIEYCVITHQDSINLSRMLMNAPPWKLVYYDESAIVVVKRFGLNQSVPEVPLGFASPAPLRTDILNSIVIKSGVIDSLKRWIVSTERLNTPEFDIGSFLIRAGFPKEAEIHLLQAASESPNLWEIWSNLGALYIRLGMWKEATQAYKTVLMLKPNKNEARLRADEAELRASRSNFDKFRIVPLQSRANAKLDSSHEQQ